MLPGKQAGNIHILDRIKNGNVEEVVRARAELELKGKAVAAAVHTLLQGEKQTHNEPGASSTKA